MPRQANRPSNTNYQDYILDYSGMDFSQFSGEPAREHAEEAGFFDKLGNSALAVAEGITLLPGQMADTARDAYHGGDIDVTDTEAIRARRERERERADYAAKYAGKTFEGVPDAMNSAGYSLTTMGASLGAGAAGSLAGPVAAGAAGMAASGALAYRATKQQFLQQMLDQTERALGRMPTQEEWDAIATEFDGEATRYGLWEAGPEALSNLFMAKILGPLGKGMFRSGLGQGIKRGIGLYGEEFATETVTQMGQGHEEAAVGLRDDAPNAWEAFREIAPATFWQTTLMAGGKKVADMAANRMRKRATEAESNFDVEEAGLKTETTPQLEGRAPLLALPEAPIRMGTENTGMGPIPMGPREQDKATAGIQDNNIDVVLDEGQAFDLLSDDGVRWGLSNLTPNAIEREHSSVASPPDERVRGTGLMAEGALPGMREDTEKTETAGQQVPAAPAPLLQAPTATQITNTQNAPRADTMAQASGLGMPAPDPMPVAEMPAPDAPATPVVQSARHVPAVPVQTAQIPTRAVGQPIARPALSPVPDTPGAASLSRDDAREMLSSMSRTQLLEHFDGQKKKDARRMTKPRMVRALLDRHYPPEGAAPITADADTLSEISPTEISEQSALPGVPDIVKIGQQENAHGTVEKHDDGRGNQGSLDESGPREGDGGTLRGQADGLRAGGRPEREPGNGSQETAERRKARVAVPGHDKLNVSYELVEAEDVQASHLPLRDFQKNQNYKLENERRYHEEQAGRDKVNENAARLDPDLLLDAPDANQGAPIIDHEGNVLGGNGRAMSIQKAYELFTERGESYRSALAANAERLGLDPAAVAGMKKPMLVRRLDDAPSREERQRLVSSLNEDFTHSREKRADSKSRGDRLSNRTVHALAEGLRDADSLRAYFDSSESAALVTMLISDGVIQKTEKAAYVGADGLLNPDGKTLVEAALRGRIARSYEALAGLPAAIVGKLDAAIPHILIAEGVGGAWNITEDVRDAVDLLAGFARSGQKHASVYLSQVNMVSGKAPIETSSAKALDIFHAALGKKKGEFAAAFARYASDAKISPEAGGLPGLVRSPDESFAMALNGKAQVETAKDEILKADASPIAESKPNVPEQKGIALKLGEHIGGSRADTARKTGAKAEKGVALASLRKESSPVVGRVGEEMARHLPQGRAGDIRLDAGSLEHIEREHGRQIRKAGYEDAKSFVRHVATNADVIYPGASRRDLALVVRDGAPWKQAVIKLEYSEEGDFYRVKTAGPVRADFFKNKSPLWERAQSNRFQSGGSGAVNTTAKANPQQSGIPRASTESTSGGTGQSELSGKKDTPQGSKVNIATGEYLPPKPSGKAGMPLSAVKHVIGAFDKRAKNAAPVQVVQSFGELPASVRKDFSGNERDLEAAYDSQSGTVWFVADNFANAGRVAEVWMHEQVVHHGLRSMLSDVERKKLLSQLWASLGGMDNTRIREIADAYGVNPRSSETARLKVMEEVIASMAEKRRTNEMTARDERLWKKIVDAILRAWKATVQAVSGRDAQMTYEHIDGLLAVLGRHVMDGPENAKSLAWARTRGLRLPKMRKLPARLSVKESIPKGNGEIKNTAALEQEAWDRLQRDIAEWESVIDRVQSDGKISGFATARVSATPDVLKRLGSTAETVQMALFRLSKVKKKHGVDLNLLRDLPRHIADPLMVFKSDTMANSYVVLTEIESNGENLIAAIHFDVKEGRTLVNDMASIYDKSTTQADGTFVPGWTWVRNQVRKGNLRYFDKNRSSRWFRDRAGLQLPLEMNRESYRGIRILTEKDVVKPVNHGREDGGASLASLSPRDILGFGVRQAAKAAQAPEISDYFRQEDLSLLQGVVQLPHWIAKKHKQFAVVYERQLKRMDERSAGLAKSLESVPSLFGEKRLGRADMDDLRALLWENEGKEPKAFKGVEKFVVAEVLENEREIIAVAPEFYDVYKKWLNGLNGSAAAKEAMLEIRKSLDADLVRAHNRMAAMADISDDAITQFRQSIGHVPNYFPHHRYGKYFVQAKKDNDVVFRQHFDARNIGDAKAKAKLIAAEQSKKYPDAKWSRGENTRLPDEVLGAPLDAEAMEQIIVAATSKIADKDQARRVSELLTEGVSDVLKARGWGAHGIGRKNIPGFEKEDIVRVLYDYKAGLNGWLTKMDAARDFSRALSEINARKNPNLWKYTSQYVRDVLRNSDSIDRITGNVKSVAFAWYLGGSLKTAFVNLTQNIVVGVPRLQMDVTGGAATWIRGAQDALVNRVTGNKGRGLSSEETRVIHELYGESVITDAFMEEVRGQLQGVSGAAAWNNFLRLMGKPMSEVERFNRASLALAAFRAARSGKMKAKAREKYGVKGRADYDQAKAFATDVVRDAHFVYGKSNLPEFLRGNAAGRLVSPMYTFRTFTHNMVNMWAWALATQGKEGAAFVAKSLGATMALGGVTALPLYATLMALVQAVTGDDDDWTETLRKNLPNINLLRDMACYGVPSIAGVSIGGSLQMETAFTKGFVRGGTPKEMLAESMGDIIGIPYDLAIEKPSRMIDAYKKGNLWRVVEEAVPGVMKNAMQAWRLYSVGQTTVSGRPINTPGVKGARTLSGWEAIGKAMGFQPVSSTKSYAAYAASEHAKVVRSDKINELTVMGLKALDGKDLRQRHAMIRELRGWNEKMKAEGKPHMLIRLKDVESRMKARRRENKLTPKTRQNRERYTEVWGM